jgi:hypothetical protein
LLEAFQSVYVSQGELIWLPTIDTLPDEEYESHNVSLVQITQTAIEKAILGLNEQKVPGPDGISSSLLRKLVSVVKIPLPLLFNLSLSTGIFPDVWKKSFVVLIFKNVEKQDISYYGWIVSRGVVLLHDGHKTGLMCTVHHGLSLMLY